MTATTTATTTNTDLAAPARPWLTAAFAVVGAVALNALGIWGDGTTSGEDDPLQSFVVVCGVIAVASGLVFGLFVPRALKRVAATGQAGVGALVLSALALVLVVPGFWTGLPPVLAAGGIVVGLAGRTATHSGMAIAAVVIGLLAIVADVAIYALDWMSTNGVL
jgi:hypothetical protein